MLRKFVNISYPLFKYLLFALSYSDPEKAHHILEKLARLISNLNLSTLLANKDKVPNGCYLSLAAGFDKNASFPADFYDWIGVNRIIIGTLTLFENAGSTKPRVKRFIKNQSMVNWLGLPNVGIRQAVDNINHKSYRLPVTISLATTVSQNSKNLSEHTQINEMLSLLDDCPAVDRIEFNLSCPNVEHNIADLHSLKAYNRYIASLLDSLQSANTHHREVFLKLSPHSNNNQLMQLVDLAKKFNIKGFTVSNSDKYHQFKTQSGKLKGGASGEALYAVSQACLNRLMPHIMPTQRVAVCGGLSSRQRLKKNFQQGIFEFQFYTPFIYRGPALLSEFIKTLNQVMDKNLIT